MKFNVLFILLFISQSNFAQRSLFDTLQIDSSTKIIGRYPQYDKNKTFEKYNFILEDSLLISKFIKNIKLGDEVPNYLEEPNFKLTIVKKQKEIGIWTVNPVNKSVMTHDGKTFKFDLGQIDNLSKEHPFKYNFKTVEFKNKSEFETFLVDERKNSNFLFNYTPQFRYEGSFEIQFVKSEQFPHPKGISQFLETYIEKIVEKNQYRVTYVANDYNIKNQNQFTMTIIGPRILFEKLKIDGLKNENWKETIEDAKFFYQEKI